MRLMIYTQTRENYGINSDGSLSERSHWKNKGGSEYYVRLPRSAKDATPADLEEIVARVSPSIEIDNEYCKSFVVDHALVSADFKTSYEEFCEDLPFGGGRDQRLDVTRFNTYRIPC